MSNLSEEEQRQAALRTTTAIQHGELPHNPELDLMLDRATTTLQSTQLNSSLNPEGKRIAQDAKVVIEDLRKVVDEKNRDEHLQKMHVHVKEAAKEASVVNRVSPSTVGQSMPASEKHLGAQAIRALSQSLVSDSEMRKILWEFGALIRMVFRESGSVTSFVSKTTGVSQTGASTTTSTAPQPGLFESVPGGPVRVETVSMDRATGEPNIVSEIRADEIHSLGGPSSTTTTSFEMDEEEEEKDPAFGYRYSLDENERFRNSFLSGNDLDQQRYRELTTRFVDLLRHVNEDPRRVDAIRTMLQLLKRASDNVRPQAQQQQRQLAQDPVFQYHLQEAINEAQAVLENFAMNKSLDPLIYGWRGFIAQTQNDPRFQSYWSGLNEFFMKALNQPEFARSSGFESELRYRLDAGRKLLSEYRALLYTITNELDDFLLCMRRDHTAQRLTEDTQRLVSDLFYDDNGRPAFKPSALAELRKILVPLVADQLKYIAVPRISGSDEKMDYSIENIAFRGQDILPSHIHIDNTNKVDLDTAIGGHDAYDATIFVNMYAYGNFICVGWDRDQFARDIGMRSFLFCVRGVAAAAGIEYDVY